MTEPFSGSQILKWGGTTVLSGLALATAAVETNPEVATALTPNMHTTFEMLILAVVGAALKAYVPSEKIVNAQFAVLEAQFKAMAQTLDAAASDAKQAATLTNAFRVDLANWMGGVDARLKNLEERES